MRQLHINWRRSPWKPIGIFIVGWLSIPIPRCCGQKQVKGRKRAYDRRTFPSLVEKEDSNVSERGICSGGWILDPGNWFHICSRRDEGSLSPAHCNGYVVTEVATVTLEMPNSHG
jgi:hypothetical protein